VAAGVDEDASVRDTPVSRRPSRQVALPSGCAPPQYGRSTSPYSTTGTGASSGSRMWCDSGSTANSRSTSGFAPPSRAAIMALLHGAPAGRRWQSPRSIASTASPQVLGRGVHVRHTSAAEVAASRTAAPPLSLRRNSRGGLLNRRAPAVGPDQSSAVVTIRPPRSRLGGDQRATRSAGCGRPSRTRGPLAWSSRASAGFVRSHDRRGVAETCRPRAGLPVPA
jgi:hypothetical protein